MRSLCLDGEVTLAATSRDTSCDVSDSLGVRGEVGMAVAPEVLEVRGDAALEA